MTDCEFGLQKSVVHHCCGILDVRIFIRSQDIIGLLFQ